MPAVFSDSFTGASNTVLNGRAATGGAWTMSGQAALDQNAIRINAANQARVSTGNGCLGMAAVGAADHYAKAQSFVLGTQCAVAVRAQDWQNFIGLRMTSATQPELYRRVAGAETTLNRPTIAAQAAPVTLEIRVIGGTVTGFVNGIAVHAGAGHAVTDFAGVTRAGLWGRGSGIDPLADDFEAGHFVFPLVAAGGQAPTRDRGQAVTAAGGATTVAAAGGRSPGRAGAGRLGAALAVAGGRSPSRSGSVGLVSGLAIAVAGGRSGTRAGTGGLIARLGVAGGRGPARADAGRVETMRLGLVTPVATEPRGVPVVGETRVVRVGPEARTDRVLGQGENDDG